MLSGACPSVKQGLPLHCPLHKLTSRPKTYPALQTQCTVSPLPSQDMKLKVLFVSRLRSSLLPYTHRRASMPAMQCVASMHSMPYSAEEILRTSTPGLSVLGANSAGRCNASPFVCSALSFHMCSLPPLNTGAAMLPRRPPHLRQTKRLQYFTSFTQLRSVPVKCRHATHPPCLPPSRAESLC